MSYLRSKLLLVLLVLFGAFFICSCSGLIKSASIDRANNKDYYSYRVINSYPHDTASFTQGLVFADGFLYESTGLYGNSRLRKIDLTTGEILMELRLQDKFFGEGITNFKDKIFQLTWRSNIGFIYDQNSLKFIGRFSYPFEGWGITHDEKLLIISDGSAKLRFLDPETFEQVNEISVYTDKDVFLRGLNELEYIDGAIYANIWKEDKIAIINPRTGWVSGVIDLTGILDRQEAGGSDNVLNGIAYDKNQGRLFVTGKLWPKLFEIKLVEK